MTMQLLGIVTIAVIVAFGRLSGLTCPAYQAFAHFVVGAVFALGFMVHSNRTTDEVLFATDCKGIFVALCLVELLAVAIPVGGK